MSEWLKEHAWKAIRARRIEQHRDTSTRNRLNDFHQRDALSCDAVNRAVRRWYWRSPYTVLTQFSAPLVRIRRDVPGYAPGARDRLVAFSQSAGSFLVSLKNLLIQIDLCSDRVEFRCCGMLRICSMRQHTKLHDGRRQ